MLKKDTEKKSKNYKLQFREVLDARERLSRGELPQDLAKEFNVTIHTLLKSVGDYNKLHQKKEIKEELKFENITSDLIDSKKNWKELRKLGLLVFAKYIKFKALGRCEVCGRKGSDAHHWLFTRAHNKITDIMPDNGIFLCTSCHYKAHNNIQRAKDFIASMYKYRDKVMMLTEEEKKSVDLDKAKVIIKSMLDEIK